MRASGGGLKSETPIISRLKIGYSVVCSSSENGFQSIIAVAGLFWPLLASQPSLKILEKSQKSSRDKPYTDRDQRPTVITFLESNVFTGLCDS